MNQSTSLNKKSSQSLICAAQQQLESNQITMPLDTMPLETNDSFSSCNDDIVEIIKTSLSYFVLYISWWVVAGMVLVVVFVCVIVTLIEMLVFRAAKKCTGDLWEEQAVGRELPESNHGERTRQA